MTTEVLSFSEIASMAKVYHRKQMSQVVVSSLDIPTDLPSLLVVKALSSTTPAPCTTDILRV